MVTMGGTKSHTVPFAALSKALVARGHNITLLSAFPGLLIMVQGIDHSFTKIVVLKFIFYICLCVAYTRKLVNLIEFYLQQELLKRQAPRKFVLRHW
jgi:hypothetical protein